MYIKVHKGFIICEDNLINIFYVYIIIVVYIKYNLTLLNYSFLDKIKKFFS